MRYTHTHAHICVILCITMKHYVTGSFTHCLASEDGLSIVPETDAQGKEKSWKFKHSFATFHAKLRELEVSVRGVERHTEDDGTTVFEYWYGGTHYLRLRVQFEVEL